MKSGIEQPRLGGKQQNQPELEISLLGSFKLHKTGHGEIKENRRKSQALLAWLLLESDQAHTREQLTTLLWPEMDRQSGLQNLRVTLSRLRKQLAEPAALETTRLDVKLHPSHKHRVDVVQFETLIDETEKHSHPRLASCNVCLDKLRKALTCYRGPFLAGLNLDLEGGFDDWLFVWRERLFLQLIDLLDKLANAYMDRGEYGQSLVYTRRQLELDSLNDSAQKRILRLLALQKNVPAALNQFKQLELRLKMEMGVEPDKEMRQLVADIQAGRLDALVAPQANEVSLFNKKLGNLPENLTPFFGRQSEIDQLSAKLIQPDYRLISIVGPGGIGKSRLALEVARNNRARFVDGAFFVPLAPLTRVDQIPAAIGHAIGCPFQSSTVAVEDQLIEFLTDKKMLVVIDNIEHLLGGIDLLIKILRRCPKVILLVTSRRMLDVQAEDLFQLEGLPFPKKEEEQEAIDQFPAVRLFCNRSRRLLKSFRLTEANRNEVVEICRLTEGMPLALELAAGWIRDLPLPDLISSIKQGHAILQTSSRDIAPQHRSIQAVFEYSWQLLSNGERELLAALSVFRGGFSANAISEIIGTTPIDLIRLCNHSLVRRTHSTGRYDLHELTRQFAAEKLSRDLYRESETKKNHAIFYLGLLKRETNALIHTDPIAAFERLQGDFDNIRSAWEVGISHHLVTQVQEAIEGFAHLHHRSGRSRDLISTLQLNLEYIKNDKVLKDAKQLNCFLLTFAGYLLSVLRDKEAMGLTQKSLDLARTIEDPFLITFNYYVWGWNLYGQGKMHEALPVLDQAEQLARTHQYPDISILVYRAKGHCYFVTKDFDKATSYCEKAVKLGEKLSLYPSVQVQALGELGNISNALGQAEKGIEFHQRALKMLENTGTPRDKALVLHYLACTQLKLGLNKAAIKTVHLALNLCEEIGDHNLKNYVRIVMASAWRINGKPDKGIEELEKSLYDVGKYLFSRETGMIMVELGNCYRDLNQWTKSHEMYQLAVKELKDFKFLEERFLANAGLAYAKFMIGDLAEAYEIIKPLAQTLQTLDTSSWDDRLRSHLICYHILKTIGDERANDLIIRGKIILDKILSKIKSEEIRQAMMENIPEHREIIALASQI